MTTTPRQSGKSSTPHQSSGSVSSSGSGTPAASGGPSNLPPGRGGAGDSTWTDWYEMYMCETQGRVSEPPGPPYPIGMAEARWEAISQIYERVARKEPPPYNIASKALWTYYTRVDPQTLSTWACQILCMIVEYHMACMTRGSAVTSSILPRELAERLYPSRGSIRLYQHLGLGPSGQDSAGGCMVPPAGHGPQRGACLLWVPSQVPTLARKPFGLLPQPRDLLGATVRGRGYPGPQGEPETRREEACQCDFLSEEV